jgi:hypothetical protein
MPIKSSHLLGHVRRHVSRKSFARGLTGQQNHSLFDYWMN